MKTHYEALDGLRGVAALVVLWLHICLNTHVFKAPPNAFLGVDFFFCLSGFVIADAYAHKLTHSMTLVEFACVRAIRLLPLVLAGALVGGAFLLARTELVHDVNPMKVLLSTAMNAFLFPSVAIQGELFGVNPPLWSLFWEVAINIAFALSVAYLTTRNLFAVLIIAGVILIWTGLRFNGIDIGHQAVSFYWGAVRVLFPFVCGVLLRRVGLFRSRLFVPAAAVLAAVLLGPAIGAIGELAMVLVLFPAIVWLGAGAQVGSRVGGACLWLGRLSYPLYVLQLPIVRIVFSAAKRLHVSNGPLIAAVCIALSVGLSLAAMTVYDDPVRRWLSAQLMGMRSKLAAGGLTLSN